MTSGHDGSVLLVTAPPFDERYTDLAGTPLEAVKQLRKHQLTQAEIDGQESEAFDAALSGAEAIVVSPWTKTLPRFTDERWRKADRLRVIAGTFDHRYGDWIDVAEAKRRNVTIVDTSRSMTPTVAEFALAMTLNLLRDIPTGVALVRAGGWKPAPWDQPGFVYGDLTGRRVGLAGYGSINRRYAELLAPFACSVLVHDPFVADDDLARAGLDRSNSLVDLAARSEIFIVGIPPTPATQGIISREVIAAMPRGALFVLVTRMAVVEQEELWRRAEAGEIRAAVDVFEPEPPPTTATFRTSPFVQPTPHVAGGADYCHRRCFTTAVADAMTVIAGGAPIYPVTVRDDGLYRGTLTLP